MSEVSPSMLKTLSVAIKTFSNSERRAPSIRLSAVISLCGKRAHLQGRFPIESIRLAWESLSYSTKSRGEAIAGRIPAFAWYPQLKDKTALSFPADSLYARPRYSSSSSNAGLSPPSSRDEHAPIINPLPQSSDDRNSRCKSASAEIPR